MAIAYTFILVLVLAR